MIVESKNVVSKKRWFISPRLINLQHIFLNIQSTTKPLKLLQLFSKNNVENPKRKKKSLIYSSKLSSATNLPVFLPHLKHRFPTIPAERETIVSSKKKFGKSFPLSNNLRKIFKVYKWKTPQTYCYFMIASKLAATLFNHSFQLEEPLLQNKHNQYMKSDQHRLQFTWVTIFLSGTAWAKHSALKTSFV